MRDLPVSKVDRSAHQKAAVPATGERDCPRPRQDEHAVPEWGHYGPTRGLGGIPSRSPRGPQPVRHPHKEGHNYAEGYPAGTPHQRGEELKSPNRANNTWSLSGPPYPPKGCIPMKAISKC